MIAMKKEYDGCPLCGAKNPVEIRVTSCTHHSLYKPPLPPLMHWCKCVSCKHVFTADYFTPDGLKVLFSGAHSSQQVAIESAEHKRMVWSKPVARVAEVLPGGKWLDVGFGDGALMTVAEEFGYEPIGTDLRQTTVDGMRRLGYDARCQSLEEFAAAMEATGETLDVVSMFDVLEHTEYPGKELSAVHRLLRTGGVVVISCPNMGCFAWRALDMSEANPYWGEIEHYHNFTRSRLVKLLNEYGFELVSYGIPDRWRLGMELLARKI